MAKKLIKMTKQDKQRMRFLRATKKAYGTNEARWVVWSLTFKSVNAKRAAEKVCGFRKGRLDAS